MPGLLLRISNRGSVVFPKELLSLAVSVRKEPGKGGSRREDRESGNAQLTVRFWGEWRFFEC